MDQGPLVVQQIDAAARFLAEFQKAIPVQAAFWLKESDEAHRYLYVASDQITDENFDEAYGEVVRIVGGGRDPHLDAMQIKVLGTDQPLVKGVLELWERYPGRTPLHLFDRILGGVSADEVYIYPLPITAPAS